MEYNVNDLIRILFRRWYVVAATIVILTGLSLFASRSSYQTAVENYESYTTETVPVTVQVGTMTANSKCSYALLDYDIVTREQESLAAFYTNYVHLLPDDAFDKEQKLDPTAYALDAYALTSNSMTALVGDTAVIAQINAMFAGYEEPLQPGVSLIASDHLTVELVGGNVLRMTVNDLPEDIAQSIWESYLDAIVSVGSESYNLDVTLSEPSSEFIEKPLEYTEAAILSQIVMAEPPAAPPSLVRVVGMAVVLGFAFGCFGILVVTFVSDARKVAKKEEKLYETA